MHLQFYFSIFGISAFSKDVTQQRLHAGVAVMSMMSLVVAVELVADVAVSVQNKINRSLLPSSVSFLPTDPHYEGNCLVLIETNVSYCCDQYLIVIFLSEVPQARYESSVHKHEEWLGHQLEVVVVNIQMAHTVVGFA